MTPQSLRRIAIPVILSCFAPAGEAQNANHSLVRPPEYTAQELANRDTTVCKMIARVSPSVVHVVLKAKRGFRMQRHSSGVVISATGLVLTNRHLIEKSLTESDLTILVRNAKGDEFPATVVDTDRHLDLALLKIELPEDQTVPHVEFGDSQNITPGETVVVAARPDEKIFATFLGSAAAAQSQIQIDRKPVATTDLLLSDVNLKLMTDGAPVLDIHGQLLAITNSSKVRPRERNATGPDDSFGFAIRAHAAQRVFAKALAAIDALPAKPDDSTRRHRRIAATITAASAAIVSVRRESIKVTPKPGNLDPYGTSPIIGVGSGVIVHPSGLVLTNASIPRRRSDVLVTLLSGKVYTGSVVARRGSKNVALIKLDCGKDRLPFIPLANSSNAILGETVAALGNRFGHTLSVKVGVLSSKQRAKDVGRQHVHSMELFQIDATIDNANTGGALINIEGQLLAIPDVRAAMMQLGVRAFTNDTAIGFAVPVDWIRKKFHDDLGEFVAEDDPLLVQPAGTEQGRRARESRVTRVLSKHASCFLNVFVKRIVFRKSGGVADELFPEQAAEQDFRLYGQGSGVIVHPTGLAITNWHVVDGATDLAGNPKPDHKVFVSLSSGKQYEVEVLSTSPADDLALLQLKLPQGEKLQALALGDSDAIRVGETVIAVGNPHGFANSVTVGLVAAKNRAIHIRGRTNKYHGLIQTDAAINPGNSGGALIDLNGYLVGINSAGSNAEANQGFAIPVRPVREKFHSKLLSSERLRSAFLGMRTTTAPAGIVVAKVDRIGPAADAGVAVGDRILRAGGQQITDQVGFAKAARAAVPFRSFAIEVERDGKPRQLAIQPVSDAAWFVFRRAGFAVRTIGDSDLLRAAFTQAIREYTGDPGRVPSRQMVTGLVVTHVQAAAVARGMDIAKGDLIIGHLERIRELHQKDRTSLVFLDTLKGLRDHVRRHTTRRRRKIELWTVRDGELKKPTVVVQAVPR